MRPLILAFAFAAPLPAQSPATPPPTLRAQARLVVVDVVVTDRDHHPIHNLSRTDFTLLEDKSPQTLKSFDEHRALTPGEAAKLPVLPPMPPGVFTNFTPAPANSAVNVLLLDALNTPLQDQAYVRNQLLQYLKGSRPGANLAIFGLSSQLVMLQGFTSDPALLRAVVDKKLGKASPLLDDQVGGGGLPDTAADQNIANGNLLPADVVAHLQTFENMRQSFQLQLRAKYTLDAMNVLARYLAAIPGRKNLIWFSGSFPINVLPDVTGESSDPFAAVADSEREYRETTDLFTAGQVAVYPIDARGLQTLPMFSAASSGAKYASNPRAMNRDLNTFTQSQFDEHSTMFRMAQDTGGRAFVNTNGLDRAVAAAIDEGSNYYTLAYTPTNPKPLGNFRKIAISLSPAAARSGYQLAYRHGYFADDPNSSRTPPSASPSISAKPPASPLPAATKPDPAILQRAMVHGVPGATQILYKVRILPAASLPTTPDQDTLAPGNIASPAVKPPYRQYSLDFAVSPESIVWQRTSDGLRRATVQVIALVYRPDGTLVNSMAPRIVATLTPERYAAFRTGIPFHFDLSVPDKGDFSIRTGIVDVDANRIGAVEIPIAAIKNLPPLSPPPASLATPAPVK